MPLRLPLSFTLALLVLACATGVAALLLNSKTQPPAKPPSERIWSVNAVPAEFVTAAPEVTLYGRLESPRTTTLTAAVTAFVSRQQVDEGEQVAAGTLLLELDPRDAQLIVTNREAQRNQIRAQLQALDIRHRANLDALAIEEQLLQLSQRAVDRIEQLKGRNVSSETQLEDAQRSYQQQALALTSRRREVADYPARKSELEALMQSAEVQLDSARLDLERTRITAPFKARITRINTAPGSRVRSGDPLLTLYQADALEVRAQIPSRLLPTLRAALAGGQPLSASAELDGQPLQLRLDRLAADVGSGRAGVDALFSLADPASMLAVGRTLSLKLRLPSVEAVLSLPAQALYGTDHIYRLEGDRLQAVAVQRLGEHQVAGEPRLLLAADSLQPGDRILTTQLPNAMTGLRVRVTP
nr:HlyD family efflux transporter periplasmic adaptor subunit [Motiliproteus sediminis]